MSDKTETRPANPFLEIADAQLAQMTALWGDIEKLQAQGIEQTRLALDETARLSKETLGYWAGLGAESRRMTMDAVKRSMGLLSSVQA